MQARFLTLRQDGISIRPLGRVDIPPGPQVHSSDPADLSPLVQTTS